MVSVVLYLLCCIVSVWHFSGLYWLAVRCFSNIVTTGLKRAVFQLRAWNRQIDVQPDRRASSSLNAALWWQDVIVSHLRQEVQFTDWQQMRTGKHARVKWLRERVGSGSHWSAAEKERRRGKLPDKKRSSPRRRRRGQLSSIRRSDGRVN